MAIEFNENELNNMTKTTLSNSVYSILRKKILDLSILPGTMLNIKELEKVLKVSKSPIRDAISKLGMDGLVDIVPQKETKVSLIDLSSIQEERFLRYVVEQGVLQECIGKCSDEYYDKMNKCINNQENARKQNDIFKQIYYDNEYHKIFFELADKMKCWTIVMQGTNNYQRIRHIALWDNDISINICEQHKDIAKYVYIGKRDLALSELDKHLNTILYEKQDLVKEHSQYFKNYDLEKEEQLTMLEKLKKNMNFV